MHTFGRQIYYIIAPENIVRFEYIAALFFQIWFIIPY